jgi:osmotically-inducible protein OsmY
MVASFATGLGGGAVISALNAIPDRNNGNIRRLSSSVILAHQVQERLRAAGYLALRDVACEVRDGAAYLNGRLRSHYLKQIAQVIARELEGIGGIENLIEVIPITGDADRRHFGDPADRMSR